KHNLPGAIYKNGSRWWWKVKLPGEEKIKSRPLKPVGARQATKDYDVAVECAKEIWARAIYKSDESISRAVGNMAELVKEYLRHVDSYHRDYTGAKTKETREIRYAMRLLIDRFCALPIEEFGPLKLVQVRDDMIKLGWRRRVINQRVGRIQRMFKWAVSRELVSPILYQGISTVEGLRRNRSAAKESLPVKPIDEKYVYAVLKYTTPVIAAMTELQLLTGMRPGEMVQMKPKDIDRSGEIWHYYPERHKNEYRGHERIVPLGPRGQELLRPFLLRNQDSYCFSPAESERMRRDVLTQNRKTPLSYGNSIGTNCKDDPQRRPGDCYDSCSYAKAIRRAVIAARKDIKARGDDPDKELPMWTPYRLRHTAATKARKLFNYETAGALLGHSNMSATAIYAERNQGLADDAARKLG
ncbi:MAG: site-specific integrase, partial [Sedimentisphaerales bacterium]|nr:site-specific integrase [Sedimentisphaerales bacterium]